MSAVWQCLLSFFYYFSPSVHITGTAVFFISSSVNDHTISCTVKFLR